MKTRRYGLFIATFVAASLAAGSASAASLTYTLSGSMTGTLGTSTLSGSAFQITVTANAGGGLPAFASANSITVAGAGSGTFTNQMAFNFSGIAGSFLQEAGSASVVAGFASVVLSGWDGVSPLGQVAAIANDMTDWTATPTSLGALTITGLTNLTFSASSAAASSFTITTGPVLPVGSVGISYTQTLVATGGTTPYTWSLIAGALPAGLSLSNAGVITGIPTAAGTLSFTVKVTDANALNATQAFSLTIGTSPTFSSALRIPQLVDGAGWKTRFAIINTDTVPVTFTFQFWNDNGTPMALAIQNGNTGVLTNTLAPGASFFAQSAGVSSALQQGWAEVASNGKIGVTAIFQYAVGGSRDAVGTEIASLSSNSIVMPFDNTQGNVTAVAIANTNPTQTISVTMTFITDAGGESSVSVVLPAHTHQAFITPTINAASTGLRGSIQFTAPSADVSVIGLEFTPAGQFTSLGTF